MRFLNMLGNKAFSLRCSRRCSASRSRTRSAAPRCSGASDYQQHRRRPRLLRRLRPVRRLRPAVRRRPPQPEDRRPAGPLPPRTYGDTNISRWRHGLLLLRMTVFALWKFRIAVYRTDAVSRVLRLAPLAVVLAAAAVVVALQPGHPRGGSMPTRTPRTPPPRSRSSPAATASTSTTRGCRSRKFSRSPSARSRFPPAGRRRRGRRRR